MGAGIFFACCQHNVCFFDVLAHIHNMKQQEYVEGPEALGNFERFATAILQAPAKKKKQAKKPASQEKPQKSDKDD